VPLLVLLAPVLVLLVLLEVLVLDEVLVLVEELALVDELVELASATDVVPPDEGEPSALPPQVRV
jgi:hypothetical protein